MEKLISVIIPSYNDEKILNTIASIKSQSIDQNKIEIIVIDSKSNYELLKKIKKTLLDRDCLISEKDKGIFDGINKGIKLAKGKLVFTIGSDDFIENKDLFLEVEEKFNFENFDIIFFGIKYLFNGGKVFRKWPPHKFNFINKFIGRQFAHFGMICKKDLYKKYGYFNFSNNINADVEFFFNLDHRAIKSAYLSGYYVNMQFGGNSSKSFIRIIKSNLIIAKYLILNKPYYIIGFFLKPIHKILEIYFYK